MLCTRTRADPRRHDTPVRLHGPGEIGVSPGRSVCGTTLTTAPPLPAPVLVDIDGGGGPRGCGRVPTVSPRRDDDARTAGNIVPSAPWLRPWRPGESGNPLGGSISALGLAAEVGRRTKNGRELVEFFLSVLHGESIPRPGHRPLLPGS
jgi:hypothetical protein